MFGRNCAESNAILCNITVIIIFKPHNCGDSGSVIKAEGPCRRRLDCGFHGMLTSHREITKHLTRVNSGVTSSFNPLVNNLSISLTNFCRYLSMPHSTRKHSLNGIYKPDKVRMCVRYFNLRNSHLSSHALGNRRNLKGKIAESVQISYLLAFICALTKSIIKDSFILGNNFIFWTTEEHCVEPVNKILLNKGLQAEECNSIYILKSAHTRSVVRNHFCQSFWILLMMCRLIKVNKQEWIIIFHFLYSFLSFYIYIITYFYKKIKKTLFAQGFLFLIKLL